MEPTHLFYYLMAVTLAFAVCVMIAIAAYSPRTGRKRPQATRQVTRLDERTSSGSRKVSSASSKRPMATLNRKQRRTLASLSRRGKLAHLRRAGL